MSPTEPPLSSTRRRPFVGGNWKMNGSLQLINLFKEETGLALGNGDAVDVLVAPPFPYLAQAKETLGSRLLIGAQSINEHAKGAFTGEVSAAMLQDLGVKWTLLGHSERRTLFGEDPPRVQAKVQAAWETGLGIILCVGEPLDIRSQGDEAAMAYVCSQLAAALTEDLAAASSSDVERLVIAYEPIWAIGTGRVASVQTVQQMHAAIRHWLGEHRGRGVAEHVRIIYGGSVTSTECGELAMQTDIDGFLVGGASLKPTEFACIVDKLARQKNKC